MAASDLTRDELMNAFEQLSTQSYEVEVLKRYGQQGVDTLVTLIARVRELLNIVPFEMLIDGLTFIAPLDDVNQRWAEGGKRLAGFEELSGQAFGGLTVAMFGPSEFLVWDRADVSPTGVRQHIAYRYVHSVAEEVFVDGQAWQVEDTGLPCAMGSPSYSNLEDALLNYVIQNRRPEMCRDLEASWRDDKRLAFAIRPEAKMRRSLVLALKYTLTGVSNVQVRPEQNQDESKPVDIEVTWWSPARAAIIEIKWLGNSGPPGATSWTTTYPASRAVSGLRQLADYLDRRDGTTPHVPVMGYLFVFDARRRGLKATDTEINRDDGLHFQMEDPEYPEDLLSRPDMGAPYRCFMEPIYT